jgi:replication factor A1
MDEVKFLAKVLSVGELRTFERDGEDDEGRVVNVEAADESGAVRLAFWDEQAQAVADGELETGTVLRVKGRPKDGYNGLEVSVDEAQPDEDADIDVDLGGETTVDSLTMGQSDVNLRGLVLDTDSVRTFDRDDGSEGRVANLALGDETGRVRVTLWDEMTERVAELSAGTAVEVIDGYVRERDDALELHVGESGAVEEIDGTVEFQPDATPIGDVEIGQTVDLAGVVRSADPTRTFDRDDGSEGQVRNVRIQDATGDIRVALWGEKADAEIAPGDEVLAADVEIQDGWQDDLEASAGWQSTVVVLDDADTSGDVTLGGGDADAGVDEEAGTDSAGLDDFADGLAPSSDATGAEAATGSGDSDAGSSAEAASEPVEFTGTVVQTGDPVVLDDGTETMPVETDADVRLGEEVTARGRLVDDRLDADDLF